MTSSTTIDPGSPSSVCPVVELDTPGIRATRPIRDPEHHARLAAIASGDLGSVHSWELVTAVDGPGTRMTLFLSGCLLRCQYCQNPDTWRMRDGVPTRIAEVLERVRRYAPVFRATGGGVTISGGEPLMQPAFVRRVFAECSACTRRSTPPATSERRRREACAPAAPRVTRGDHEPMSSPSPTSVLRTTARPSP